MKEFELDWERERRTGIGEAVLCMSKSAAQIDGIVAAGRQAARPLLLTRLLPDQFDRLAEATRAGLDYDPLSMTAFAGQHPARDPGACGIVAAGTSDLPVAREAQRALAFHGRESEIMARFPDRDVYLLRRDGPDVRAPLVWEPLSVR